ncbi:hypothetical protein KY289_003333 [Solanum tuberosum]|nr:hypothetical protein KY289_003333 [Solanum tuberosum]
MENFPPIDLGADYYIVKFSKEENMMTALQKGPWFINGHYLSVRQWEPNFVPDEGSLTHSAAWIRLPHLPTKFYDGLLLTKICGAIGNFLAITQASSLRNNTQVADEVGQMANIDGHVDMQMEETNLPLNLSPSNPTILLTNAILYKSHSKDFQSSHANLHSTPSTISSIIGNHVETTISPEQEKNPTTPLLVAQFLPSKHEQLFSYPPTGCSTSFGGGNPTSPSPVPDPILDRIHSAYHRGYEVGNGQLCEPLLDGKCVVPPSSSCGTISLPQHAPTGHATQVHPQTPMESHQPPIWQVGSSQQPPLWQAGSERDEKLPRNSFTKISTLRHAALMLFPEKEDKKYIHMCPVALAKCSFDLRLAMNIILAKYAVVLIPTLLPSRVPPKDDPLIVNPSSSYSPMINPTSFIVWSIRGGNNPTFKRNLRELIHNHNLCMVALLETRMTSHERLKDEFEFDDFLEVLAIGRSEGLVLLWNTALVSLKAQEI